MTRIRPAAASLLALTLALTGCSSTPTAAEVAERFAIELAAAIGGEPDEWADVADDLADDALNGNCGKDVFWTGLGEEEYLLRSWAATCLLYFEGDMSDGQVERAKETVVDGALERDAG